ncbi:hypothetical protein ONZ51_g7482 [Trametes cubensis]|uniref:Uncharacterized protein n=1 Tax=Trametes cubensis TaxID=1111947 RepID=A0AAD7TR84_9APHY|nr:hypothetical protein ONZ51_g7482 [Trametes cubensis]
MTTSRSRRTNRNSSPTSVNTHVQIFVKRDTYDTLQALFLREGAVGRVEVDWKSLRRAMLSLGFAMTTRSGRVREFVPPDGLASSMTVEVSKPSKGIVQGKALRRLSQRMTRLYGWGPASFKLQE